MHNLSDAVTKVVSRHHRCLQPPIQAPATPKPAAPARQGRRASNTRQRHTAVHASLAKRLGIKAIARQLQLDRKTVRKYARAERAELGRRSTAALATMDSIATMRRR
jgi:DNA-binding NarL/FixJ family response regulator